MGEKSFFKYIGVDASQRLRFRIRTARGHIVEVVVQLEVNVDGGWKPVVRYDNAHDFPHRDILTPKGEELKKTILKLATLAEVLEYAEQDLTDRADWYVERFLNMRRP